MLSLLFCPEKQGVIGNVARVEAPFDVFHSLSRKLRLLFTMINLFML